MGIEPTVWWFVIICFIQLSYTPKIIFVIIFLRTQSGIEPLHLLSVLLELNQHLQNLQSCVLPIKLNTGESRRDWTADLEIWNLPLVPLSYTLYCINFCLICGRGRFRSCCLYVANIVFFRVNYASYIILRFFRWTLQVSILLPLRCKRSALPNELSILANG